MKRQIILTVSCDSDPDKNPTVQKIGNENELRPLWQGIEKGIGLFRQSLLKNAAESLQRIPITWLLRADRQILELYNDAAYSYKAFEKVWQSELTYSSELGWHPHLYRWNNQLNLWRPYLGKDDDIEILEQCLLELKKHVDITSVRTGWDYCTNNMMHLFAKHHLKIDASAIPYSKQNGVWNYDWSSTTPLPYFPSVENYRITATANDKNLNIVELPVITRKLKFALHAARFGIKNYKSLFKKDFESLSWKNLQHQGVLITNATTAFKEATEQAFANFKNSETIFVNTFFHPDELLNQQQLSNFIANLNFIDAFAKTNDLELNATSLTPAAEIAKGIYS